VLETARKLELAIPTSWAQVSLFKTHLENNDGKAVKSMNMTLASENSHRIKAPHS
jgi:hypothetical protein